MITKLEVDELICSLSFGTSFVASMNEIFESKTNALMFLSSPDWRHRCTALEVLSRYWHLNNVEWQKTLMSALTDVNEDVRIFAIVLMSRWRDDQNNDWSESNLERISRDMASSKRERNAAEHALAMKAHRRFKGSHEELIADTRTLLSRWNRFDDEREKERKLPNGSGLFDESEGRD